ncbi:MAG: O-antigen ligase family protein [Acidobacteriia bacterium]|nr:O-antigen ligase family protein [Terriglobia bacterium]
MTQDLLVPRSAEGYPRPVRGTLLYGILWLMLWGGYNTDFERLLEPGFPRNALDLFHGLRAFFPIVAGWLAGLMLLAKGTRAGRTLAGPLGLLAVYALIGIISSLLLSSQPLTAVYWACQYASVILVLCASLSEVDPLPCLSRLLGLNWIVVVLLAAAILSAVWFDPDVKLRPGGYLLVQPPGGGASPSNQLFGMATTRSTGAARYAAIAGLAALAKLWQGTARSRSIWAFVLLFSVYGIVLLQARTALLAFLAGAFLLLWLRRSLRPLFLAGVPVAGLLLAVTGSYGAFWARLTRGKVFDPTLSGRTVTWQAGWALFQESPWLGWGFHADRIFLGWQHMHNALLHALVQTGVLGTVPYVAAIVGAWIFVVRLYRTRPLRGLSPLPIEIPAVLAFFTIASITESTFAFFGTPWLLSAPLIAYVQVLAWQTRRSRSAIGVAPRARMCGVQPRLLAPGAQGR